MNLLVYVILQIYVGKKMWNGFLEMKFLVQINLKNNFRIIGTDLFFKHNNFFGEDCTNL